MKCEPKIRWKAKINKLSEVSFAKLNNVPKKYFKKVLKSNPDLISQMKLLDV